jgi:hypothetical protein
VLVGSEAKVLDGFSGVLWSSEEEGVASGWGTESQLVQSQNFTTSSKDASTGGSSETEGSNADLGNGQETVVIGDSANNDDGSLLLLSRLGSDSGDRDGRSVDTGHKESSQNDLVEGGIGTT